MALYLNYCAYKIRNLRSTKYILLFELKRFAANNMKVILVFVCIGSLETVFTENEFYQTRKTIEDQQMKIRNLESTIQIQKRVIQRQEKENRKMKNILIHTEKHSNYLTNNSLATFVEKCIDDINMDNKEITRGKKYRSILYYIFYTNDSLCH